MSTITWENVREHERPKRAKNRRRSVVSRFRVLLKTIGIIVTIALSFGIIKVTGLHDAIELDVLKVGLGFVLASWFVLNFRIALYEKDTSKAK